MKFGVLSATSYYLYYVTSYMFVCISYSKFGVLSRSLDLNILPVIALYNLLNGVSYMNYGVWDFRSRGEGANSPASPPDFGGIKGAAGERLCNISEI